MDLDKMYPRMAEPDEEGIDLHPADPRRRFIAVVEGAIFRKADPVTPEEEAEVEKMWEMMNRGNYTKDPKDSSRKN